MTSMRSGGIDGSRRAVAEQPGPQALRPGHPGAPSSAIGGPADVWRMVRRHMLMVLVLFGLIAGSGIAATWYKYKTDPQYVAEARIRIDPPTTRDPRFGEVEVVPTQLMDQYIQTNVNLIESSEVLNRIFDSSFPRLVGQRASGLEAKERTLGRDLPPDTDESTIINRFIERQDMLLGNRAEILGDARDAAPVLRKKLKINQVLRTNLISIRLQGRNPELIAHTVNSVVDSYMLAAKDSRKQRIEGKIRGLRNQERDLEDQLTAAAGELRTFQQNHGIVTRDAGADLMQRASRLELQLLEAQAKLREARMMHELMEKLVQQDLSEAEILDNLSPMMRLQMETDRETAMLVAQKHELTRSKEALLQQFSEEYSAVKTVNNQIATIDQQLETRRKALARMLLDQQRMQVQNDFEMAASTVTELASELSKAKSDLATAAMRQTELDSLRQQHEDIQTRLAGVRESLSGMETAANMSEDVITISEVAHVPGEDERVGSPVLYSSLAVLLAMALSVGLAMMVELIDNRVRTPQEVVRSVQMPVLGVVPDGREDPSTKGMENLSKVAMSAPQSLFAESFRQLRTALLYSTDTDLKTLLVTSPQAGEGKTTVAGNLAVTLANGGSRILLVDANFRRPAVHLQFDLQNTIGLSSVLARLNDLDEAVQQTQVANMEVLACGPLPPSPADLLGSQAMQDLLAKMRDRYDGVILDGPPMLLVADGHVLASMVDGVAVVMSGRQTSRGVAMRTKRMLQGLRARVVGGVLNRARAQKGGYFRESFRAYYEYSGKQK